MPAPATCAETTGIATAGTDLCVDGRKHILKCVDYDSTAIGDDFQRFDFDALLPEQKDDAARIASMNANTIRIYAPRSDKVAGQWLNTTHLDALQQNGLHIIIAVRGTSRFGRDYVDINRAWTGGSGTR